MQTLKTPAQVSAQVTSWRQQGLRIAFVPTMGNLHAGHLNLCRRALQEADKVVASIFVNPLQFGPSEDLEAYPRTLERDSERLQELGVGVLFAPAEADLYPQGREGLTRVEVPAVSEILCGASRPGHFVGVTTVVNILFNIVQPDVAVFGEKDFQQLFIIRRMVRDLHMPVDIIGEPTCREADGLAMSSRNHYLDPGQRQQATGLYQVLEQVAAQIQEGNGDWAALEAEATASLQQQGFRPDYFSIRSAATLMAPAPGEELVILAAAWLGSTRLIDNLRVSLRNPL